MGRSRPAGLGGLDDVAVELVCGVAACLMIESTARNSKKTNQLSTAARLARMHADADADADADAVHRNGIFRTYVMMYAGTPCLPGRRRKHFQTRRFSAVAARPAGPATIDRCGAGETMDLKKQADPTFSNSL
jgi:hypothetical protein